MKQLIVIADMEGASGIFEENKLACSHGSMEWLLEGRANLTSDVKAVCDAANASGMESIFVYDGHFAGCPESNIIQQELPENVRFFDLPDRCFFWRRIRGQAEWEPFGIITVGQHARYGEEAAYFPHTIQSPPLEHLEVNGLRIAEIGMAVLNFCGTRYLANIGCSASHREARELSPSLSCISVKDKHKKWQPSAAETYPLIFEGVRQAIQEAENKPAVEMKGPCELSLSLLDGFCFEAPETFAWKGCFEERKAIWEAPNVEIGLEIFNEVRACIKKFGLPSISG